MQEKRRDFLKKALGTSAVVATAGVSGAFASGKEATASSNGVIRGKSPKKERFCTKRQKHGNSTIREPINH